MSVVFLFTILDYKVENTDNLILKCHNFKAGTQPSELASENPYH